ncbi:hypothetical protein HMPREF3169_05265 [Corynebacterium sp. HMSC08C04]|uniref:hypothetical protein n=1 Tax=Corynebacterium sp. HMSC08C04 TaxID=1581137 RepID=UPI0008A3018C|nr:hypothetical protein [Corynebacterium sp. HMSC08C04]OFT34653.1 hypothetical protein HMPREF3169_05265 [Corynebacterium sp. HMSC08C04]
MPLTKPANLGAAGSKLWDEVTNEYVFDFEPDKAALLERACRTADAIATLEEAAADADLVVQGSQGQPVISPLIAEARQQTLTLNTLIKSLKLEPSEAEQAALSAKRRAAGAKGLRSRYGTTK